AVVSGASAQEIIEKLDGGGIDSIRAGAKNFTEVAMVSSQNEYSELSRLLAGKKAEYTIGNRRWCAARACPVSSNYHVAIFNYFNQESQDERLSMTGGQELRYGENPHQKAVFYKLNYVPADVSIANAKVLQGKALSYNNMLDADAARKAACDAF